MMRMVTHRKRSHVFYKGQHLNLKNQRSFQKSRQ